MLALVIVCQWWMLWLLITIGTFIWAMYKEGQDDGGWFPAPPIYFCFWLIGNLIMWLIYFIIRTIYGS